MNTTSALDEAIEPTSVLTDMIRAKYGQVFWETVLFEDMDVLELWATKHKMSIGHKWEEFGVMLVELCEDMHTEIVAVLLG